MNNENNNQTGQNTESQEIYLARLSLLGSALATLGDGLQTIVAGIALQELEKASRANSNDQNTPNQSDQTSQLENMQKQIDLLTSKVERMERGY